MINRFFPLLLLFLIFSGSALAQGTPDQIFTNTDVWNFSQQDNLGLSVIDDFPGTGVNWMLSGPIVVEGGGASLGWLDVTGLDLAFALDQTRHDGFHAEVFVLVGVGSSPPNWRQVASWPVAGVDVTRIFIPFNDFTGFAGGSNVNLYGVGLQAALDGRAQTGWPVDDGNAGCFWIGGGCDFTFATFELGLDAQPTSTPTATATATATATVTPTPTGFTPDPFCGDEYLITTLAAPYTASSSGGGNGAAGAFDGSGSTYWQGTEAQNVEAQLTAAGSPYLIYGFGMDTFPGVAMTVRIEDLSSNVLVPTGAMTGTLSGNPWRFYEFPGGPIFITGVKVFAARTNDFNPHLIRVLACTKFELPSTPTPTVTATPGPCSPPATPGAGTPTATATATPGAGTPTVTATPGCTVTPTPSPAPTSTGSPTATPIFVPPTATPVAPPPGGTVPAPGGGTPGGPAVVPTPIPGVFPTVVFSDPFGDTVSPCAVVPAVNFLSTNYVCPAYAYPGWPGFTLNLGLYFSYVVQFLQALYGSGTCFIGSMFNYTLWFYNLIFIDYHWLQYFWCMMSELLRLIGLFLSRVWNMVTGLFLALIEVDTTPAVFLGLDVDIITDTLINLLSNFYVRTIFDIILAVVSLSMWFKIAKNFVGASSDE